MKINTKRFKKMLLLVRELNERTKILAGLQNDPQSALDVVDEIVGIHSQIKTINIYEEDEPNDGALLETIQ